jgi:hypothetical protein
MNLFLGRLTAAGLVIVLQVAAASGCAWKADPLRSAPATRPASTFSTGSGSLPWEHDVPEALVKDPAVPGAQQGGVLIASRWVTRTGVVTQRSPEGRVLAWPSALPVPGAHPVQFTVSASVLPVRVDIRQFAGPLDASGAPIGDSRDLVCEKEPSTTSSCTYALGPGGTVTVDLAARADRLFRFVVLYAQWYIPVSLRPGGAAGNPVVNASWGFEVHVNR